MNSTEYFTPDILAGPCLQNGSPVKSTGSGNPSDEDTVGLITESQRPGTSGSSHVAGLASSSKEKEKQRLSLVAPKRAKGKELVKEEEPWDAKNILSFDGGGIRGLYSLFILQQLMQNVKFFEENYVDGTGTNALAPSSFHPQNEPLNVSHTGSPQSSQDDEPDHKDSNGHYLPCHYFDYICGTSTGGLIAIMLGRLRMTVEDCIAEYQNLASNVFGNPRTFHQTFLPTIWLKRPKYDATTLERIIKGVINRRGELPSSLDYIERYFHTGDGMCRTFVYAYKKAGHDDSQKNGAEFEKPYIFRSYNHFPRSSNKEPFGSRLRNPGSATAYPLWMIARATTAAPMFFAPMQLSLPDEAIERTDTLFRRIRTGLAPPKPTAATTSPPVTFIDGGFGPANNPSEEAFHEVTSSNQRIGTLVSIGTGRGSVDKFHTRLRKFIKAGMAAVGDPELAHEAVDALSRKEDGFGYFRFNQHNGLPDIEFDEWKPKTTGKRTQRKILAAVQGWASDPHVTDDIRRCAIELVRRRRLRTADESRWERYANKAHFDCKENMCPTASDKRWYSRDEFRQHLIMDHKCTEEGSKLENIIRHHRTIWRYKPH